MPAWVLESVLQGRVSARIFTFFLQFFSRREFLLYFFKFSNDFWGEVCMSRFARDRVRNIVKSYIKIYYMLYIAVNLPVGLVQDFTSVAVNLHSKENNFYECCCEFTGRTCTRLPTSSGVFSCMTVSVSRDRFTRDIT